MLGRVARQRRVQEEWRGLSLDRLGWHYLSNATCRMKASFVLCVFRRVKDRHNLLRYSPLLKKTSVRQVGSVRQVVPPDRQSASEPCAEQGGKEGAPREQISTPLLRCHLDRLTISSNNNM